MIEKLGKWTAVIASVITVGLTLSSAILNAKIEKHRAEIEDTKAQIEKSKLEFERVDSEIKKKYQEIEERKERTTRYEFVNKLLPDILKSDKTQATLTTNLITLALTEEEARKLFDGFRVSQDTRIQEAGKIGSESLTNQLNAQRGRLSSALAHEAEAFDALIEGKYDKALSEFKATDLAYPTFHQAYEISRLLEKNLSEMSDPEKRKVVFRRIVKDYSYGAPAKYIQKLDELAK